MNRYPWSQISFSPCRCKFLTKLEKSWRTHNKQHHSSNTHGNTRIAEYPKTFSLYKAILQVNQLFMNYVCQDTSRQLFHTSSDKLDRVPNHLICTLLGYLKMIPITFCVLYVLCLIISVINANQVRHQKWMLWKHF